MQFRYKEVIDLGFIRQETHDGAFFDTYGVQYIIVHLNFEYNKCDYIFEWCQHEMTVKLMKCDKNGNILMSHIVESIEQLKMLIGLLKK